ncbi:DUF4280 domain-containing protein [Catenovulum sp. SM1970]|uniref:DUF4280 domain-containing protein n=1 Tax=Marinifaba aquimaris TaxID=2741323 RepID=UPI00157408E6|nr:DUF4280 domain-containing protein [Marinifaba aquimaris]NTS75661.1 DUF4280 domain-containing protein [Marinifaba aquimaris]
MAIQVTMGANLMCTMGVAPSALMVLPTSFTLVDNKPAANIMDFKPFVNIMPFGMCKSPSNPAVAAATAAAMGTLTPMPCTPMPVGPWMPGSSTCMVGNFPALNNNSKCMCAFAGTISITNPGSTTTMIP